MKEPLHRGTLHGISTLYYAWGVYVLSPYFRVLSGLKQQADS
jgi:hypothetical protein